MEKLKNNIYKCVYCGNKHTGEKENYDGYICIPCGMVMACVGGDNKKVGKKNREIRESLNHF